jgi:hypothetical protein
LAVDVLGALSEKLKSQANDTQNLHNLFNEVIQQYKEEKINEKEFFSNFLTYLISFSATSFLTVRVLLELKSAIEKGTSIKDLTGGTATPSSSTTSVPQASFGISGFINPGGNVGGAERDRDDGEYTLPKPQQQRLNNNNNNNNEPTPDPIIEMQNHKKCNVCSSQIRERAKFCSKCGNRQSLT